MDSTGALVARSLVNRHNPSFGSRSSRGYATLVNEGMIVDMVKVVRKAELIQRENLMKVRDGG